MKSPLFKNSFYAVAFGSVAIFAVACQKTNLTPGAAASAQSEEAIAASLRGGLYASAADTAAAVNNLYMYNNVNNQLQFTMQYATNAKDGNGVYYNKTTDEIYQLSRKNKTVYVFSNASTMSGTPIPSRTITDTTLSSGREITYDDKRDILYVANNSDSSIRVYKKFSTLFGTVIGSSLKIQGQPWGITYDRNNNVLLAAMDLTAMRLDIFDAPNTLMAGAVTANRSLNITDRLNGTFSRIHGLSYDSDNDILVVTEIGEAAAPITPTPGKPAFNADGGLYIFMGANAKIAAGGSYAADGTIYGASTTLGNPVDVIVKTVNGNSYIYAAEKANKKILTFKVNAGDTAPFSSIVTTYSPEDITLLK